MKFPLGAMTVGDILDRSIKILIARLGTFYSIHLLVSAPLLVLNFIHPFVQEARGPAAGMAFLLGILVVNLILQPIETAAALYIIAQEFVDQHATIGSAFRFAFHSFGRLLGASILVGVCVGVGTVFCIVPGILFMLWYIFVGQVVVVEGRRMQDALNRSKELGAGYRGRVFGLLVLMLALQFGFSMVAGVIQVVVLPTYENVSTAFGVVQKINVANHFINVILTYLVAILAGSFATVCWTLCYFDLRIRKEGFDLELAAKQQTMATG